MTKQDDTAEQKARDILDRMGIENAQQFTAGDVVEISNLIRENDKLRNANSMMSDRLSKLRDGYTAVRRQAAKDYNRMKRAVED